MKTISLRIRKNINLIWIHVNLNIYKKYKYIKYSARGRVKKIKRCNFICYHLFFCNFGPDLFPFKSGEFGYLENMSCLLLLLNSLSTSFRSISYAFGFFFFLSPVSYGWIFWLSVSYWTPFRHTLINCIV